jgi:ophiobolin F synthase
MTLSKDEDAQLDSIRKSCYTALSLANDYFSFDCEYANFQQFSAKTLPNSVWLCMQWHQVDSNTAKEMIKQEAKRYEEKFLEDSLEYRRTHAHLSEKLDRYLDALSYQVSGSTVWSLNCPRYHQDYRYDPNAGIEDSLTAKWLPETLGIEYVARKVIEADEDESDSGLNGPAPNSEQSRRTSTKTSTTVSSDDSSSTDDSASLLSSASSCSLSSQSEGKSSASGTRSALLDSRHVDAPYNYITSFPSKGVREAFADALNIWLDVPEPIISRIKALIGRVHATTLVFDDIEDGSSLRRGQPVTHKVFGIPQTINSGCYELVQIVIDAQQLSALSARNVEIVLEQLVELHIGQSYDLYWTHHGICPSEAEYVEMSAKKMGGFFQLLMLLLFANGATESTKNTSPHARLYKDVENLVHMIGVQYQILNDYQNLQSSECTAQKGFCEDLDEGKCSFPLIHALTSCPHNTQLREILQRKRDVGYMPYEDKLLVLEQLELAGSMEYTVETLKEMQRRAYAVVEKIEKHTGKENWIIRSFLQRLEV